MYRWWVFIHIVGVLTFLAAHGVSMVVTFRLRRERDPQKVTDLLVLSSSTTRVMYVSLLVLLLGGVVAGFLGQWWSQAWIWISIGVLVASTVVMYSVAKPYYVRVRLVAKAKAAGSQAVTDEQFDEVLRSGRADAIATIGVLALLLILYMMIFKPTFASAPGTPVPVATGPTSPGAVSLSISARNSTFSTNTLTAPAGQAFSIVFDNQDPGVPHNVAIYTDSTASTVLFRGQLVTGPTSVTYRVPALQAGTYFFRCDIHPPMTGTFVVR